MSYFAPSLLPECPTMAAYSCTLYNALCGYPHVKVSIRDLSQISTAAPIFQLYIYFRQNLEENVTFTFFFLVLPQISLVKYYETIKILMQIFVYFKLHFHNEGLDCEKNYFEMFFCDWPLLSSWKISAFTVQPFMYFVKKLHIFYHICGENIFPAKCLRFYTRQKKIISFGSKLSKN